MGKGKKAARADRRVRADEAAQGRGPDAAGAKEAGGAAPGDGGQAAREARKAAKEARKAEKKAAKKAAKQAEKAARKQAQKAGRKARAPERAPGAAPGADERAEPRRLSKDEYEKHLRAYQIELVKLQEWVKAKGLKVVAIFEGRDAAGKGGVIKRVTESLNPRICRVVALPAPTEREKTQWYFQRYVAHLPAAGEIVLFDRSWYNRAGVERVMGFCTDEEYADFLRTCPEFERMLQRSGIVLVKYWFSVSDDVQEKRFQDRMKDPTKRWKLSPMDLESRSRWVEYSKAKDENFRYTDTKQNPWYVVRADDKKRARLNCIRHLLSLIPYEDLTPPPLKLPPRKDASGYKRPPLSDQTFVPEFH